MRKNSIITSLLGTIALVVIVYLAYVQLTNYIRVKSVNECMENAKVELRSDIRIGQTNYTTTRTQPITEWFDRCLQEKGYVVAK